jgi:hypothetical protein
VTGTSLGMGREDGGWVVGRGAKPDRTGALVSAAIGTGAME